MINQTHENMICEIIEKHADMVFRIAFTHTKNRSDADDILQEVFTKLFRLKVVFETDEHIKAWLIRVTYHTSINLLKSAWNRKTVEFPKELPYEQESTLDHEPLTQAVQSLPSKYRIVIHLFYYEEMSVNEIAKTLKIKNGTIKSQLSRAREILKNKLTGGYEDVI